LGDGQFKHIQQIIEEKGISMNICAANEHVPEVERYIRTIKERVRICHDTIIQKVSAMTNHQDGVQLCVLAKQFPTQR